MSLLKCMFVFGVLAVSLRSVQAVSSEEKQKFHTDMSPYIIECSAQFGLTKDDIQKVEDSDTYETLDPCILACIFKKSNTIDDQGLYDADKAEYFMKKFLSDEADQKKATEIISNCKEINLREVTDGKKGCERAKLLYTCFGPLKAMFAS